MAVKARQHSAANTNTKQWETVGWQRITVQAPRNWALTAVSGDDGAGSFRIERVSEGETRYSPFGLDIRWSNKVNSAQNAEQLDKRIKPLIDTAGKSLKKGGKELLPHIDSVLDNNHPERGNIREYSWRGSPAAMGRIWRCNECGRLIIAQAHGDTSVQFHGEARHLLNSIECHNPIKGWSRWALYGVDVTVPDSFGLAKHQLMTTYIELRFGKIKNSIAAPFGEVLTVEQWGAASVQLKGRYVDEWIERKSAALLSTTSVQKSETVMHGHPGLRIDGRRHGLGYWLGEGLKTLRALKRPALDYRAVAWECPDSNKVYLIQHMTSGGDDFAAQVAATIHCHSDTDGSG